MEKNQIIFFICFVSLLLIILLGFLLFILLLQRNKSNKFIREREALKREFNEQLLRVQLEIQEQSFNGISMEIHDNVGQTLSLLKMQLSAMEDRDVLDHKLLTAAKFNAGKALADLRDIAGSLSTHHIRNKALADLIGDEINRISGTGMVEISLLATGESDNLSNEKKLILFRMLQECLQNIIKHAHATNVNILMECDANGLNIEVKDDGVGFDDQLVIVKKQGLGLQNIIHRATVIGGEAKIKSSANQGTVVTLTVPYN